MVRHPAITRQTVTLSSALLSSSVLQPHNRACVSTNTDIYCQPSSFLFHDYRISNICTIILFPGPRFLAIYTVYSSMQADGKFPSTTKTLQDGGNLTIVNLNLDEQGVYECIAWNVLTTIITTTLLIIQRKYDILYKIVSTPPPLERARDRQTKSKSREGREKRGAAGRVGFG